MQGADESDINVINFSGMESSINLKLPFDSYKRYNALEDGKWYTVRLVTSVTGADQTAVRKNVKLYIDGNNLMSLTSTDTGEDILAAASALYYNKILFDVKGGTAYIDNIKVIRYYGTENEPVNYGQLLSSIRKGDNKAAMAVVGDNVTSDIYNTFIDSLADAKAVFESNAALAAVEIANDALCRAYSKFLFKNESVSIGAVCFADAQNNYVPYLKNNGKINGISITKKCEYGFSGSLITAVYNQANELQCLDIVTDVLSEMTIDTRTVIQ
jgi:hypothetical protein